ncbi:MAG: CHAT domain-containing protein [Bacteroidetes bacterium]|nr:MAG: CHAT domain-containing protein [Bacteroidota bacterium]
MYYPDNVQIQSYIFTSMGGIYARMGQFDLALNYNEKGIEAAKSAFGEASGKLGILYKERALIFYQMGDFDQSLKWNQAALDNFEINHRSNDRMAAEINISMGITQTKLEQYEPAIEQFRRALRIYKTANIKADYVAYHLANAFFKTEKYDSALVYIQQVLNTRSNHFDASNINENPSPEGETRLAELTVALFKKADILFHRWERESRQQDLEIAFQTASMAHNFLRKARQELNVYEQSNQLFYNSEIALFEDHIKIAKALYEQTNDETYAETLFNWTETNKFYTFLTNLRFWDKESVSEEIWEAERSYLSRLSELEQALIVFEKENVPDSVMVLSKQILEIKSQQAALIEKIRAEHPDYYRLKYETPTISLKDLQASLSPDVLWLEYVVSPFATYVLAVDSEKFECLEIPVSNQELSEKIGDFHELLQSPFLARAIEQSEFINLSTALYDLLIKPVENRLTGIKKLEIAAEDELFYLPFETLIKTAKEGNFSELDFLIRHFEVSYHYSATARHALASKPRIKDYSLLAFAPVFSMEVSGNNDDPLMAFSPESAVKSRERAQFSPLPETEKEVKGIESILQKKGAIQTEVLLFEQANKENFIAKMKARPVQFLHIASHGVPDLKNPKTTFIACFPGDSPASDAENVLYANEIRSIDIQSDLVVLSSCESGIGKLMRGEGLMALNRSFLEAGANNVLFSLWKINDQFSKDWMMEFYKKYDLNKSYAETVRAVKLEFLKSESTANPRFWAPFVLIGE